MAHQPLRLAASQRDQAADVLAKAFMADPVYARLFPDPDHRSRALRQLWRGVISYCLVYGEVHTTPTVSGAACWLSPGNTGTTLWRTIRTRFALPRAVIGFGQEARTLFLDVLALLDRFHKEIMSKPHWYLWALGVDPACQGQGIGGALIAPVLALDMPCYLEALTEANVAFYEKRGFVVAREQELSQIDQTVWMMVFNPSPGYARNA
jgi:ribosomal protein S18 acetylase RimI-like enzyme